MSQTYKEQFDTAMACKDKQEAADWLGKEIAYHVKEFGQKPEEAERVIKTNLGYMAGYYGKEEAQKVKDLFGAVHPIFGDTTVKSPTPEEAFAAGQALMAANSD